MIQCEICQENIDIVNDKYLNLGRYKNDPNEYYCIECGLEVITNEFLHNGNHCQLRWEGK